MADLWTQKIPRLIPGKFLERRSIVVFGVAGEGSTRRGRCSVGTTLGSRPEGEVSRGRSQLRGRKTVWETGIGTSRRETARVTRLALSRYLLAIPLVFPRNDVSDF
jgi:hypothetical protein